MRLFRWRSACAGGTLFFLGECSRGRVAATSAATRGLLGTELIPTSGCSRAQLAAGRTLVTTACATSSWSREPLRVVRGCARASPVPGGPVSRTSGCYAAAVPEIGRTSPGWMAHGVPAPRAARWHGTFGSPMPELLLTGRTPHRHGAGLLSRMSGRRSCCTWSGCGLRVGAFTLWCGRPMDSPHPRSGRCWRLWRRSDSLLPPQGPPHCGQRL